LVQIFLDFQHDYLEDRVWAAAGLVVSDRSGPIEIVETARRPPDESLERVLLERFVVRLLKAARLATGGAEAHLHLYLYDQYDQKVVLGALGRHLDALAAIRELFDLLTATPALSQPLVSFIAEEVRQRQNLGVLGHSLPLVARRRGFDWTFDGVRLFE